ncbi:MAG: hypothetical protein ACK502_00255 [Alphaproteobacteria bacterium]
MTTLLDAGYFHIKELGFPLKNKLAAVQLPYQKDIAYLVHLKAGKKFTPPQDYQGLIAEFEDAKDKARRFVLLRPAENGTVTIDKDMIGDVKRLTVMPSPTEIQSLEYGLTHYGKQIDKVAILFDDLGLPSGISENLGMLMPEAYPPLLATHGKSDTILLSERKARNKVSKLMEKQIKRIGKEGFTPESEYNQTGFVVGTLDSAGASAERSCSDGNLVLTSPSIMDEHAISRKAIALNRKGKGNNIVPSCGVFEAGRLMACENEGADRIISVYHAADDATIRVKNVDGAFIYAWLKSDSNMRHTIVTLGESSKSDPLVDEYTPDRLRDNGGTNYKNFLAQMTAVPPIRPVMDGSKVVVSSPDERAGPDAGCRIG